MKLFCFSLLLLSTLTLTNIYAQGSMPAHIKERITYPALDFHPWIGVMSVEDPVMRYDPTLDYKVAIDLYGKINDSTAIHPAILEVARTYNLNIANGVPAEKIQLAAVIHGGLVQAILTDEDYQQKYGLSNPNIVAIKALEEVGVKFYVCGQSMGFYTLNAGNITPMVKMAISAKTTFITLDQMGYSYLNVSED
ncbi:DsrE family protein [Algoriphagus chordae]|uniref:Intracellular sulfur oxidation DsrE/DsrF family protein n=1 Tax=Algoriphagus chordae TaxID=237019 RepID=A0A2W7QXP2_9BACT|nr:DsrE family protein [Algoriphagus chordae]PZX53308.1 intracellular sulfur oxidation DsrE/DsrF family protein [Algoriphagus chordae]